MPDHAIQHGRTTNYRGAQTAASFGDPAAEFHALRTGCGVAALTWRRKFLARGEDRVRWLNGMVTNNVRDLAPSHGLYSLFLNPQGRIQADLYCYNLGDALLLDTDAAQFEHLRAALDKYIIMDDVELADSDMQTVMVAGPEAEHVLSKAGIFFGEDSLEVRPVVRGSTKLSVVRIDDPHTPTYQIWCPGGERDAIFDEMTAAGATPVGSDAIELLRIWSGRPLYGQDIRDRDLPQETGQERALNFSKGCYLGQEIVERIRSRGAVHRTFTGFAFESGPPARGAKVTIDDKEVGEITSSATLPGDEGPPLVALGYIRREHAKPDTVVHAGEIPGRVVVPPFEYVKAKT